MTELLQADDVVVALLHDKAKLGDATVERDLAHIWTMDGGRVVRIRFAWKAALLGARLLIAQGRRGSKWTDLIVVTGSCSGTFLPMGDEFTREGRSLPP